MPSSEDLGPMQGSFLRNVFIKSTFSTKEQPPPSSMDLTGQTGIVTGGNTGIGFECAGVLLKYKLSKLIVTVRSTKKGEEAAAALTKAHPSSLIEVWNLDLGSYDSIKAFAQQCATLERIDFVILNAGMVNPKFQVNASTGHEEVFQVNYLSNVLLASLLLPILKQKHPEGRPGRLTLVCSALAYVAKFAEQSAKPIFSGFDNPEKYSMDRYATSKLLGMMFVAKLKDYVAQDDVVVNVVEPGFMKGNTNLDRHQPSAVRAIGTMFRAAFGRSLTAGAWMYIYAALTSGDETHGSFLLNWEVYPYATIMYTEEGKKTMERLWNETMDELGPFGVSSILSSMRGDSA